MTLHLPFCPIWIKGFDFFNMAFNMSFWTAILNLKIKTDPNTMNTFYQICKARISGK